jgi:hypothetical protein
MSRLLVWIRRDDVGQRDGHPARVLAEDMHEAIAIVVVSLFMVVATVVARLGLRMIGGSDKDALREFFAVLRRLSSDIGARQARRAEDGSEDEVTWTNGDHRTTAVSL